LLSNAAKFSSSDGTISLRVFVERASDETLRIVETSTSISHRTRAASVVPVDFVDCEVGNEVQGDDALENEPICMTNSNPTASPPHAELRKCFIRFEVEDCGVGVSEKMREKLFQPFKQSERTDGGTGIGERCAAENPPILIVL